MALTLTTFKNVNGLHQDIIEGNCYNGIVTLSFASGETSKTLWLSIPTDITLQFITSGLTLTPYDNTFGIRQREGDTGTLVGGTPITTSPDAVRNMNRNVSDTSLCTFLKNPTGMNLDGDVLEDFDVFSRQSREKDFLISTKTIKNGVERIYKPSTDYMFNFYRTTDTSTLEVEYRFIWIEY